MTLTIITNTDDSSRVRYRVFDGDSLVGSGWVGVWKNSRRSGSPGMRGYQTAHLTGQKEARRFIAQHYRHPVTFRWIRRGRDWMNLA